jgi:SAM-dependent methyltransferase
MAMRTRTILVSAAAAAGVAVLVARFRGAFTVDPLGAMPGRWGSRANTWLNRPVYRLVAEALALETSDELLDVACGWGGFLVEHGARVRFVAGLDHSKAKVGLARERLAARLAAGTAEVVHGDAGTLPWEAGRFSAVSCMDAFPFFPDRIRALGEMRRVLRPGGRAVVQMGWRVSEGAEPYTDPIRRGASWTEAEVRRMMGAAGFEEVSISHGRFGGDNPVGNLVMRLIAGTDEATIVRGVAPAPAAARDEEPAAEPAAVG